MNLFLFQLVSSWTSAEVPSFKIILSLEFFMKFPKAFLKCMELSSLFIECCRCELNFRFFVKGKFFRHRTNIRTKIERTVWINNFFMNLCGCDGHFFCSERRVRYSEYLSGMATLSFLFNISKLYLQNFRFMLEKSVVL